MSDVIDFELPDECSSNILELFEYWRSIHPESGLPARRDFDPLGLPPACWPNISLMDVTKDPLRFRFRLVGTEVVRFKRRDGTGQWLDEFIPGFENCPGFEMFRTCAMTGRPEYGKNIVESEDEGGAARIERICLPLASDGVNVDVLLLMTNFHDNRKGRRMRAL
ncbi:MAG: PAS domain-containing protein [Rhodospirillaceae bacterium]|jgi:hypothetical protein|nr:PAS domain-containing protein [Rhodospirillaceae bacterium]MBT5810817.1 PAS domain-containing protein [Rhodospirillaceae bacterium]